MLYKLEKLLDQNNEDCYRYFSTKSVDRFYQVHSMNFDVYVVKKCNYNKKPEYRVEIDTKKRSYSKNLTSEKEVFAYIKQIIKEYNESSIE